MNKIIIQTPRLELHGISPARLHELFETMSEDELKTYIGGGGQELAYYREMHEKGMETFRITQYFFLVVNKETGLTMGEIGFHTINNKHMRGELFYLLRKDEFKGHRFMTEAIGPVIDYGFNELGLHRIEAKVAAENKPSVKLLLRKRFTKESTLREDYFYNGTYHDSECYILLKSEWHSADD